MGLSFLHPNRFHVLTLPQRAEPGKNNDPPARGAVHFPFNPSTSINYELPKSSVVRLSVYDILGREVSVLVNQRKNAGSYEVKFDAAGSPSGVYFYRLKAGDFVQSKKFVLLK